VAHIGLRFVFSLSRLLLLLLLYNKFDESNLMPATTKAAQLSRCSCLGKHHDNTIAAAAIRAPRYLLLLLSSSSCHKRTNERTNDVNKENVNVIHTAQHSTCKQEVIGGGGGGGGEVATAGSHNVMKHLIK